MGHQGIVDAFRHGAAGGNAGDRQGQHDHGPKRPGVVPRHHRARAMQAQPLGLRRRPAAMGVPKRPGQGIVARGQTVVQGFKGAVRHRIVGLQPAPGQGFLRQAQGRRHPPPAPDQGQAEGPERHGMQRPGQEIEGAGKGQRQKQPDDPKTR